ncbi:hypothetical protein SLNSH_16975 [Alsobacter soli]|uniref:Uncharacterized protein n=1 Tax=Alsobacter soli TaxID=2109933 RepID=A0A2T1HQA7_9HYPH|nr:hypothetical protein [Alsobacter soli]PSC03802.1 hypothetical protein SLNSH_16975 [Alsobacter soli]
MLHLLERARARGDAKITIRGGDECALTNISVRPADNVAVLLFRRSDASAATPYFEHAKTRAIRKADKLADEAVAVSAHLFVELSGNGSQPRRNRAVLEEMPGLGRSYIESILKSVLQPHKYSYTEANGEDAETYTIAELEGFLSATLGEALKDGRVPFVQLVREGKATGFDTEAFIPKEQKMKLAVKASGPSLLEKLRGLRAWATREGWDDVRVQIVMPEGRSRLVSVPRDEDAGTVLFVRSEQVYVKNDLEVCHEDVSEELTEKAKEILSKAWHP